MGEQNKSRAVSRSISFYPNGQSRFHQMLPVADSVSENVDVSKTMDAPWCLDCYSQVEVSCTQFQRSVVAAEVHLTTRWNGRSFVARLLKNVDYGYCYSKGPAQRPSPLCENGKKIKIPGG